MLEAEAEIEACFARRSTVSLSDSYVAGYPQEFNSDPGEGFEKRDYQERQ